MGKNRHYLKLKFWPKHCKKKIIQALASSMLERKVCFSMCYNQSGRLTLSLPNVVILQPGTSTNVLNAADARPNDIHRLPVGGRDVRNSSNSFALRWRVYSSEVAKLKCFCFDLALKLALYT